MVKLCLRLILVVGGCALGAACVDDGTSAPRGTYQAAPAGYGNPYYNSGYYGPAPAQSRYGYAQLPPTYNYPYQQAGYGRYNQGDGRRYTTVTVTNRGQNGYRDDVVQQQVVCGSQYSDGYRTRTAPQC